MSKLDAFPGGAACRILATRLFIYLGAIGPAVSKLLTASQHPPINLLGV